MEINAEIERLRSEILRLQKWIDRDSDDELLQENERLRSLKTPTSAILLNITKALLDAAEAECERLRAALRLALVYLNTTHLPNSASIAQKNNLHEVKEKIRVALSLVDEGLPTAEDARGILKPPAE